MEKLLNNNSRLKNYPSPPPGMFHNVNMARTSRQHAKQKTRPRPELKKRIRVLVVKLLLLSFGVLLLLLSGWTLIRAVEPQSEVREVVTSVIERRADRVCTPGSSTSWGSCETVHRVKVKIEQQNHWFEHHNLWTTHNLESTAEVRVQYVVGQLTGEITVLGCEPTEDSLPR